jgi:hypothetical protein|tara:strand:+ start:2701 stop:3102 length:402 start_codon:yes stop_codon:yes gene_type:complete
MIRLLPDTASQTIYVSPFQARKYLATFTNYLIEFKSQATSETFIIVIRVNSDNERYTSAAVGTHIDQPTLGNIKITDTGLYTYTIWGQNSTTNLDPTDASVVGECEVGVLQIISAEAWKIPVISIPDNVVYYE